MQVSSFLCDARALRLKLGHVLTHHVDTRLGWQVKTPTGALGMLAISHAYVRLLPPSSKHLCQLTFGRQRVSSFVTTSNRAVEEWLRLFDDPILSKSALDRLANSNHQIVIESTSYRERLTPHRKLLGVHRAVEM